MCFHISSEGFKNLATLAIALAATVFAGIQVLLAREKFRKDLFDERFKIYKAIEEFLAATIKHTGYDLESMQTFHEKTQTASFLFNEDILKLIEDLKTKAKTLSAIYSEIKEIPTDNMPARLEKAKKREVIFNEVFDMQHKLNEIFSPYLKYDLWKILR